MSKYSKLVDREVLVDGELRTIPVWQATWAPIPQFQAAPDFDLIKRIDASSKRLRLPKPIIEQKERRWVEPRMYKQKRRECLLAGMTARETERELIKLSKFYRTQAFYNIQNKKQERRWKSFFGMVSANTFYLPQASEDYVQYMVCSDRVPQKVWQDQSYARQRALSRTQAWKDAREASKTEAALQTAYRRWHQERHLEQKMLKASIDWKRDQQSRRRRLHLLRTIPDLLACQKQAIVDDWLDLESILAPSFYMRDCTELQVLGRWSSDYEAYYSNPIAFYGQMEQDAHGESGISRIIQASDTIQEDSRDVSSASSIPHTQDSYAALAATSIPADESKSCDRWFTFHQFLWTTSHLTNQEIYTTDLPGPILDAFENSPNFMLFRQHIYWSGDITVRVVVNSNMRQYGQLQCRFYYGADHEYNHDLFRSNIYVGSQMPHCLVSANTSNTGELHIPFQFTRPYLCVAKTSTKKALKAILGRFKIAVVVPLTVKSGTQASCSVCLQIKFSNNKFVGQVYRNIIAQGPLIDTALKAILNLDKPSSIQSGSVMVPQNVGSWAAGTGCDEWTVPLRLNPNNILPYGEGRIPNVDEMSIKHVASIFGMFSIIDWKSSDHSGKLLKYFDATPTLEFPDYPTVTVMNRTCYVLPPVSVISNLFAYWRGSLKLRLDIVGAADLSGRLLVCYVPRASTAPSFYEAVSCPHAIFDLQEKRQFVFDIPYVADRMFWWRRHNMDRNNYVFIPPGKVFIFIYNDLIANLSIPDDCKIVCYLAAGPDFEVSVPTQPNIGLSYNTTVWLAKDTHFRTSFKEGYYPSYVGSWHKFGGGKFCILRYSEVSDHVVQMSVPDGMGSQLYKKILVPMARFTCPIYAKNKHGQTVRTNAEFFVLYPSTIGTTAPDYWYLIPFLNENAAKDFVKHIDEPEGPNFATPFIQTSDNYAVPAQMQFTPADLSTRNRRTVDEPFPQVYVGQMDERSSSCASLMPLPSVSGAGNQILGESFLDFKDLCRRYQRYASGSVDVDPSRDHNFDAIQLRFPAMPQGLELDLGVGDDIHEYWNRTRDGPIPIVASGYRFFTGGLRFRIVVTTKDEHGNVLPALLFVQHRPGFGGDLPIVSNVNYNWLSSCDLHMPGFAYHIQNEMLNNIVSVEIPYYLPSIRGYLQRPQDVYTTSLDHSLGEVVVSVRIAQKVKFTFDYEIFYSLADDSRFCVFQGFPPVFPIFNIPDVRPTQERTRRAIVDDTSQHVSPAISKSLTEEVKLTDIVKEETLRTETVDWATSVDRYLVKINIPLNYNFSFVRTLRDLGSGVKDSAQGLYEYLTNMLNSDSNFVFVLKRAYLFVAYCIYRQFPLSSEVRRAVRHKEKDILSIIDQSMKNEAQYAASYDLWLRFYRIPNYNDIIGNVFEKFYDAASSLEETSGKISSLVDRLNSLDLEQINESVQSVSEAAGSVSGVASQLQEGMAFVGQLLSAQPEKDLDLGENLDKLISHIMSIVINVSTFAVNPNVSSFVSAILNIFNQFGFFSYKFLMTLPKYLNDLINNFCKATEPTEAFVGNLEESDTALASYVSTLVAGVAGILNFTHSLSKDTKRSLAKILIQDLKEFALTSNHLFVFCKNNLEFIKATIEKLWKTSPGISALSFFEEFDDAIFAWAKECLSLLDHANRDQLLGNLLLASRVYDCANEACLIQLRLLDVKKGHLKDKLNSQQLIQLNKIIKDICKLRDELARAHVAPPVKFEPYVIHIHGDPGIGKSFVSQNLPVALLDSIGYKSYNELVFVRAPGNAYWNGLSHQPVVIYDDWYQYYAPEFGGIQIAELLQLKTRAVFNPPMAAIEDKNIRYNPLIVFLVSNCSHPKYADVAAPTSLYRRVDLLVHVQKVRAYRNHKISEIPDDVKGEYRHIEFMIHNNVLNESESIYRQHITYAEFAQLACERFKDYYTNELRNYQVMMRRITALYPDNPEDIFKLPGQQFWRTTKEYLNYVKQEDEEFNQHAYHILKFKVDQKVDDLKLKVKQIFQLGLNKIYGNMDENDDDDFTTTQVLSGSYSETSPGLFVHKDKSDALDGVPCVVNEGIVTDRGSARFVDTEAFPRCVHEQVCRAVIQDGDAITWCHEMNMWMYDFNPMLWDWETIRPRLYEAFPGDVAQFDPQLETYCLRFTAEEAVVYLSAVVQEPYEVISYVPCGLALVFPILDAVPLPSSIKLYKWAKSGMYCLFNTNRYTLFFSHRECCHARCYFQRQNRSALAAFYSQTDPIISNLLCMGESLEEHLPEEYLRGICSLPEVSNNEEHQDILWLKGFWGKVCSTFTRPTANKIYWWVSRFVWAMILLSPIWAAWFAVKTLRDTSTNIITKKVNQDVGERDLLDYLREKDPEGYRSVLDRILSRPQGFASGDPVHKGKGRSPKSVASKYLKSANPHYGQMNVAEFESLQKVILRNTFFLVQEGDDGYRIGRCLGLFGNVAIIPYHYMEAFQNNNQDKLYYISAISPLAIDINLNSIQCKVFENSALCVIKLPNFIPLYRDIRSRFAEESMHSKMNGICSIFEIIQPKDKDISCQLNVHNIIAKNRNKIQCLGLQSFGDFEVADAYSYDHFSGPGRCGSVLIANNLPQGIIGIHVAGSMIEGISEVVTREMVDHVFEEFGSQPAVFEPFLGQIRQVPDCQVQALGRVASSYAHRESEKSRIVPSLIQQYGSREDFPVYTDVAVLSPKDKRLPVPFSPMIEGVKHHGNPLIPFNTEDINEAGEDLINLYLAKCRPIRAGVGKLTKLEACRGLEGVEGYDHLEWRTSEGFPFVANRPRGQHDKKWLFNFDAEGRCISLHQDLLMAMKIKKEQRLENIVPFTVFTDCLKDTTVSLDKVLLPGKTRIFSMAPVDFTIQQRQLTMDFCVAMMANRLDLEHAVGINPDSMEWTELAQRLLKNGRKIITGDYSKFGDSIPFSIILMFFKLINKWYVKYDKNCSLEDNQQRFIMAYEIGQALHLMFDLIYRCICGQPSGNSLTVLLNSFTGSMYLRMGWLDIMRDTAYAGLASYAEHVCAFTYGDDVIISVSDEVAPHYNAQSLCDFFGTHNLKFTNANKSETIIPFQSLEESDFLKRSFSLHPRKERRDLGVLMAPLSFESIEDTVNWVWNSGYDFVDERSPDFVSMCKQVCADAARNAWTRGPEYYSQFCNKLKNFWVARGEYVVYDSWDILDRKIFDLNLTLVEYKSSFISKFKNQQI